MVDKSTLRSSTRVAAAAALLGGAIAINSTGAAADGTVDTWSTVPDGGTVQYRKWTSFSSPRGTTAYDWGFTEMDRSNLTIANNTDGDIRAEENNDPTTTNLGATQCTAYNGIFSNTCDYYHTHIYSNNLSSRAVGDWKSVQCHEVGHTFGMSERSNAHDPNNDSCEVNGTVFPLEYDAQDLARINSF